MELHDNWWEEKRSAYLYSIMADYEKNLLHKKLFLDLQNSAEKQAELWAIKMKEHHLTMPEFKIDLRTRLVAWLVKTLGTENTHHMLAAMKIRGMSIFTQYHNEHKHTGLSSANNVRAAIFGINDGLVSNMSLILGLVGANTNQHFIILAGVAGLLAGACSMGAGEYISVRSQREIFEHQISIERKELEEYPEEEAEELSLIYQARGISVDEANKLAQLMIQNPETALNTLAREELGLNPEELVSPFGAMISSFFAFAIGAIIPLIPFLVSVSSWNIYTSIGITALTLFLIGSILSLLTNRNPIYLGLRMLCIGATAGLITFVIGNLLGRNIL